MPYLCFACKAKARTLNVFLSHVRSTHWSANIFRCLNPICLRSFKSFKMFKRHFDKCDEPVDESPLSSVSSSEPAACSSGGVFSPNSETSDITSELAVPTSENLDTSMADGLKVIEEKLDYTCAELRQEVSDKALCLVAKLSGSTCLNRRAVQEVVEGITEFSNSDHLSFVRSKVLDIMKNHDVPEEEILRTNSFFDAICNPFDGLDSEYLRMQALLESDVYIEPKPYLIGSEYVPKNINGVTELVHQNVHGYSISMKDVLTRFLCLPGALEAVLKNYDDLMSADEPFCNIIQGKLWREKVQKFFPQKIVLPLSLYGDDFEPDNTMGSHSGQHKIGAVYYHISCLPPECISKVENLFLGAFYQSDNKVFGMHKVYKPVLDDLIDLEVNGIVIRDKIIYFALCSNLGDNLYLNELLGYIRGFSGNYPCRLCKVSKNVLYKMCYADPSLLRNPVNYAEDVARNNPTETGVQERCFFSKIPSFGDPTTNPTCDIMHDIFEGVGKYDMGEIVHYLVKNKFISLITLNERVRNFDFSLTESGNVLPPIKADHVNEKTIKMSSLETLTLIRYFSVIIGDYVPQDDPVWEFYLKLREIVGILTAPTVSRNLMEYLRVLIAEHHEMYITLFKTNLKPKYHFMTHYPDLMPLLGPLGNIWTARHESKHRPSKQYAHISNSRTNLPLSLAIKHQLQLANRFLSRKPLLTEPVSGPAVCKLHSTEDYLKFYNMLPVFLKLNESFCLRWVEIKGTKYAPGMVLVLGFHRELPLFGVVKHIVSFNTLTYFVTSVLRTVNFDQHFYSYHVIDSKQWKCVQYEKLESHQPLKRIILPRTGRAMVVTRFEL